MLVGHDPARIVAATSHLLEDSAAYRAMAIGTSPYGDGQAAGRIVSAVGRFLGVSAALKHAG
jgi:UDP-N-acetylglucosamine 2-epimerase (non-hydrolysing)